MAKPPKTKLPPIDLKIRAIQKGGEYGSEKSKRVRILITIPKTNPERVEKKISTLTTHGWREIARVEDPLPQPGTQVTWNAVVSLLSPEHYAIGGRGDSYFAVSSIPGLVGETTEDIHRGGPNIIETVWKKRSPRGLFRCTITSEPDLNPKEYNDIICPPKEEWTEEQMELWSIYP